MKKTILSLAAVLTLFASVPTIYAAPVVGSASEVSVNEFVSAEPTVNIIYRSDLDVPGNALDIMDGRNVTGEDGGVTYLRIMPGEHKVVEYNQLSKGQKLQAGVMWYSMILADGSTKWGIEPMSSGKEIIAEKDGYYLVDIGVPNSSVKEYHLLIASTTYGKQ